MANPITMLASTEVPATPEIRQSAQRNGCQSLNLELALQLCDMGLSVIPAVVDKAPCVKWKKYQAERPTADQIRKWDANLHPPIWGIVTGPVSGRVVVDFDGAAGEATRANVFTSLEPHVKTPSGGSHIHVTCPPFAVKTLNHKTSKAAPWAQEFPGVDIRATGGFEALIGATDKGAYKILRDLAPYPWPALPPEFRRYFEPKKESVKPTITALIDRALANAPADGRNNQGFWLACQLRDNGYTEVDADQALLEYQSRTGPTNTKGQPEPYSAEDARKSVREAYKAAAREPWGKGRLQVVATMPKRTEQSGLPPWLMDRMIKKGKFPLGNLANAALVLREYPDWKGRLRLDELNMRTVAVNPVPIGEVRDGLWQDQHDLQFTEWLQNRGIPVAKQVAGEAAYMVACESQFHPVRDYLMSLEWDLQPRLPTLLHVYCGARGPEAQSHKVLATVGANWMVQAVARVMTPGVKADYTLVLEGDQGIKKSSAFRVLGGDWYTDDLAQFGTKDASLGVAGVWIMELPELVRLRGVNINMIKSFLTRERDRFRPPYGRHTQEVKRCCVFCGTTNDDTYLLDPTGNRRFWPIRCHEVIDVDALARDRDQLWAEAFQLWKTGHQYWIEYGSEIEKELREEQDCRLVQDEWEEPVLSWARNYVCFLMRKAGDGAATDPPYVTADLILRGALGVTQGGELRAAAVNAHQRIGAILKGARWRSYRRGPRGCRQYRYYPPLDWDWRSYKSDEELKQLFD